MADIYTGRSSVTPALPPSFRPGEYVEFGKYPQWHGDTSEPIEWLALENDGKTALLLAKYGLDCKPFHKERLEIGWDRCDLRKWLNGAFLRKAFSNSEQRRIKESDIYTDDNPEYGTAGCGETRDKVFCLSIEEAWRYFGNVKENYGCTEKWHSNAVNQDWWVNRERACKATAYAVSQGAWIGAIDSRYSNKTREWWFDNCVFWLRSPGSFASRAARVSGRGTLDCGGYLVNFVFYAVRPALRIIL